MSKTKTIWDKSMSSRKKIFFNSKHDRRMRRWSERAIILKYANYKI